MKNQVTLFTISFIVFLIACQSKHDTHYRLSDAQKSIVTSVSAGDTVIWQNSSGKKDTAIVQPVVYQTYLLKNESDGDTYGEKASYTYRFVGARKTNIGYGIEVRAESYNPQLSGTAWLLKDNYALYTPARGLLSNRKIGGVTYSNVYWSHGEIGIVDTVFWNEKGCLSTTFNSETLFKMR